MNELAKRLAQRAFFLGDRVGIHVLPRHYYTPVASRKDLQRNERQWRHPMTPMPFEWDIERQVQWLCEQAGDYPTELTFDSIEQSGALVGGMRYGLVEAQFLYGYIRTNAPARIVEIGSGASTWVMSTAVSRNISDGRPPSEIRAYDPYMASSVQHLDYVEARAEGGLEIRGTDLGLSTGDLLFIDSTHALRTGSELSHLYLELLPLLPAGVVVHIHDIYLPYLYAPNLYSSMFDWQETVLVAALLTGNSDLEVLASMSGIFHARPSALADVFAEFVPRAIDNGLYSGAGPGQFPTSIWLRRTS